MVEIFNHATTVHATRPLFGTKRKGEWQWITYADFKKEVDGFRAGLASLGVVSGDRVAIISNNRVEWAVAAYATYGLGAAIVPMYESQAAKEWEYILNDCTAKVVVAANSNIAQKLIESQKKLSELKHIIQMEDVVLAGAHSFATLQSEGAKKSVPTVNAKEDDIAGLIYTSGTTGNPKGVMLTHKNIAYNVCASTSVFPIRKEDRSLSFLPWAHVFGQTGELHMLFCVGASMAIAESIDKIIDNLAEVRPTVLQSVPRIFNRIYERVHKQVEESGGLKKTLFMAALANADARRKLADKGEKSAVVELKHKLFDRLVFSKIRARFGGQLRYAVSGGAALSRQVGEFMDNIGMTIFEGYGLTETSPVATVNWPGAKRIGTVGKTIPGIRVEIDRTETGDPVNGEIIIYGHNVMKGYYKLPAEDEKVFTKEGGFRTGDMGYLDEDKFLHITGRIKEQYKLENGKYVVPSPLEELLKLSPWITNCFVYGDNRLYNVALLVPEMSELRAFAKSKGLNLSDDDLRENSEVFAAMKQQVETYSKAFKGFEKIKTFAIIGEDFTNENGMLTPKMSLKRRAVMERYKDTLNSLYA